MLSLSPLGSCQRSKTSMTKSDSLLRRPKRKKVCTSSWYVFIFHPSPLLFSHPGNALSTTPCPNQSQNKNKCHMPSVPRTWGFVGINHNHHLVSISAAYQDLYISTFYMSCVTSSPLEFLYIELYLNCAYNNLLYSLLNITYVLIGQANKCTHG